MEKIFLIFFVKKNSKSFEKKNPYHGKKTPIMVTYLLKGRRQVKKIVFWWGQNGALYTHYY